MDGYISAENQPLVVLGQELMRRVYADESTADIITWLMAQLHKLGGAGNGNARLTWEESFELYERILEERAALAALPEGERKVFTWPWSTWNRLIDPLEPGMLAVLAAGDGVGKTIYAENIAEHWAKQGRRVAFLHFELNRAIMLDRRAVRHTGIPRRTLKDGVLTTTERVNVNRAHDRLKDWPGGITYVHTPGWTMERALGEIRSLMDDGLCDMFVVDYLEKAAASLRQQRAFGTNIYAREADDVELLKTFSETVGIPCLLLAQMNKAGKGERFEDLDRTAIRGAGEKTEKANVVVLLHRENAESQMVKVRVDKNTLGPTGNFEQVMETARFNVADPVEDY